MQSEKRVKKLGRLKYGNPSGDWSKAQRCGAKTRKGTPCLSPAMSNGRCRMHGGKSTGPKTPEGIQRIRETHLKHGRYTMKALEEKKKCNRLIKKYREFVNKINQEKIIKDKNY